MNKTISPAAALLIAVATEHGVPVELQFAHAAEPVGETYFVAPKAGEAKKRNIIRYPIRRPMRPFLLWSTLR
ncbi:MAG: hypothetical protein M0R74_15780, partial [Dehalococcoidia bacterium]|nr:hypothetical protein [Dehalococcoidia bacterium]